MSPGGGDRGPGGSGEDLQGDGIRKEGGHSRDSGSRACPYTAGWWWPWLVPSPRKGKKALICFVVCFTPISLGR